MTGAFGALGLLLVAVGLYGVVAYSVTERRQELAIRTALGATPAGILRLALGRRMDRGWGHAGELGGRRRTLDVGLAAKERVLRGRAVSAPTFASTRRRPG